MQIDILSFKPVVRGTLVGFADIQLADINLTLFNCVVHRAGADGAPWIVGADGIALKDERGRLRYEPAARWATRAASDAFRRAAVDALRRAFPSALDGEAG